MTQKKKIFLAVALFVGLSLAFVVLAFIFRLSDTNTTDQSTNTSSTYIDSESGELVVNSPGKTAESVTGGPLILGFSKFIDYGLSSDQSGAVNVDIRDFASTQKVEDKAVTKVSVIVSTITQTVGSNKSLSSNIKVNDKVTYYMRLSYTGVSGQDLTMTIYTKEGGDLLYTSPPITYEAE